MWKIETLFVFDCVYARLRVTCYTTPPEPVTNGEHARILNILNHFRIWWCVNVARRRTAFDPNINFIAVISAFFCVELGISDNLV